MCGRCCVVYPPGAKSVEAASLACCPKSSLRWRRVLMVDSSAWEPSIMRSGTGLMSTLSAPNRPYQALLTITSTRPSSSKARSTSRRMAGWSVISSTSGMNVSGQWPERSAIFEVSRTGADHAGEHGEGE